MLSNWKDLDLIMNRQKSGATTFCQLKKTRIL